MVLYIPFLNQRRRVVHLEGLPRNLVQVYRLEEAGARETTEKNDIETVLNLQRLHQRKTILWGSFIGSRSTPRFDSMALATPF